MGSIWGKSAPKLLAQLRGVAVVRVDIGRAFEEERLVQAVELFLDGLGRPLGGRDFLRMADRRSNASPSLVSTLTRAGSCIARCEKACPVATECEADRNADLRR